MGAVVATVISVIALITEIMELSFRDNLWRKLLPQGTSQNVVALVPPAETLKQDIILIGHIDSHRTPIIFRSKAWVDTYKRFVTVLFTTLAIQTILYFVGVFVQWSWIWPVTVVTAICSMLLVVMCIQADSTPFSVGANDNASSVGLVLTLAEKFKAEPLRNTRLWITCTGCEEVQHYGAIDFFKRHRNEFTNPKTIAFELTGCAGPAWLKREGIVVPFYSDTQLRNLAEKISDQNPDFGAYPAVINGGNTEMADAVRVGVPAITIGGLTREGDAPYWHQVEDTFDKIDPDVLKRTFAFTCLYLKELDQRVS